MNKFTLALALGASLTVSLAAPTVKADPINTLTTPSLSASTFNSEFTPVSNAPAMQSNFQLYNASNPVTGVVQSEVLQGTGQYAGLTAYAYQVSLSPNTTVTSTGAPVHVDYLSYIFNGTPVMADLAGSGTKSAAFLITGGTVGNMSAPINGTTGVAPDSVSWQADPVTPGSSTLTGTLRANFVNTGTSVPPLSSGNDSATFVVLTNQPFSQDFVNVASNTPQTGGLTSVYAAMGTVISPSPVPEPATILAWAGMAGAVALVRKVRKSRIPVV
jgi:hypothetical protein